MSRMHAGYSIPAAVVIWNFTAAEVERAFRSGGLRMKRLSPGHPGQVEAVYAFLLRELDRNPALRSGLARAWERQDPERAQRMRAAVRRLDADPDLDGLAWFRALAAAEGWAEAMQACYLLAAAAPVLCDRVWTGAVAREFQARWEQMQAEAAAATGAEAPLPAASGAPPAPEAPPALEAPPAAEAEGAKQARLDHLLKAAQQEVRRVKDERAELQRRLEASLARAESYQQEARKLRAERDLIAAQLCAVAGWPAPRERVRRLVQALWQALGDREEAAARAGALATELADLRAAAAAPEATRVAAARQSRSGAGSARQGQVCRRRRSML